MDHVVFFPAHDGTPAFRRVASLEEAVRLVEHLRNAENVDQVGVYALTEVPLAFKAYYKVEVPEGAVEALPMEAVPVAEDAVPVPVPVPAVEVPAQEQPVVALAASNGETVAPGSMGFFAS
jgi:hypothetical protein